MQQEDKCTIISDFENLKDIPYQERCTEYSETFGMYVFKLDCRQDKINERFAEAKSYLEGRVLANGKKLIAVFSKTIAGNIQDTARYQMASEKEMLIRFCTTDAQEKKLGVQVGEDVYMLVRQEKGCPAEMLTLPFGLCEERYMERLDFTRNRWMRQLEQWKEQELEGQIKRTAEVAGSALETKQSVFPYAKEIKKRMENCEKVFREERMEGYDFREVNLQGAIFLNCKLAGSNFAGVNLEDVFFFNCDLKGCIWYGAMLNNCVAYGKGEQLRMSDRIRTSVLPERRDW